MQDLILLLLTLVVMTTFSYKFLQHSRSDRVSKRGRRALITPPCFVSRNNRKPRWVVDEVIRLKAYLPRAGSITLAHTFNRLHGATKKTTVSKSYVAYTVRANLLAIARLRHASKHARPRGVAHNIVWGIDMTGKTDTAGKLHMIFGVIDHGSRRVLTLCALANKSSWFLLGHLCFAIGRRGKPKVIRSDNERVFTSLVFRSALRCFGIRHQRIDLGCPWMNGRIERFFGTLKQALNYWAVDGRGQLQASLDVFLDWYCCVRPHANLDGATPMEAWCGIDPFQARPGRIEWFEEWDGLLRGFRIRRT
jgi:putative transposase